MLLWVLASACALLSLLLLFRFLKLIAPSVKNLEDQRSLIQWLQKCEEKLISGFPLEREDFEGELLRRPEYRFISEWIDELRSTGQALLPTLRGLRDAVTFVNRILIFSQTKVSPTRLQAKVSLGLVLFIAVVLYYLLEGPGENLRIWISATVLAGILGGMCFLWVEALVISTLWKGSQSEAEKQWFSYFLFPERLIGAVQIGNSLDEAWLKSVQSLSQGWKGGFPIELLSLWAKTLPLNRRNEGEGGKNSFELKLLEDLKAVLQHSLYQGTPVLERVEVWKSQTRIQFEAELSRRLETLPHRCLQPLYLCVAPAVLGLLGTGLWLELQLQTAAFQ